MRSLVQFHLVVQFVNRYLSIFHNGNKPTSTCGQRRKNIHYKHTTFIFYFNKIFEGIQFIAGFDVEKRQE